MIHHAIGQVRFNERPKGGGGDCPAWSQDKAQGEKVKFRFYDLVAVLARLSRLFRPFSVLYDIIYYIILHHVI